ncbi:hypothetical protein HII13_004557 [Brettanomyces bruxellensis]|nr:hypothetical protein HII13_004557 [Brettanomyces bruxellensis]
MYYSSNSHPNIKYDKVKGYLCLKSRWVSTLFFDAKFWGTVLVLIFMVFLQNNEKFLTKGTLTDLTMSVVPKSHIHSNLSFDGSLLNLEYKFKSSQNYPTNLTSLLFQSYVNSTFSQLEEAVNNTIFTNHERENKTNTAIADKVEYWRSIIISNLTAQSNNLKQFQKDLNSDSWVPSSNSAQLNELNLNYTWINSLLKESSLQTNTYTKYYKNLDLVISELEALKNTTNKNITTDIRSYNKGGNFSQSKSIAFKSKKHLVSHSNVPMQTSITNGTIVLSSVINSARLNNSNSGLYFLWLIIPMILVVLQLFLTYKQYINEQNGVRALENAYISNKLEFIHEIMDSHKVMLAKTLTNWFGSNSDGLKTRISWVLSSFMGIHATLGSMIYYILFGALLHFSVYRFGSTIEYKQSIGKENGASSLSSDKLINITSNMVPSNSEQYFTYNISPKIITFQETIRQANLGIKEILDRYNISSIMSNNYSYLSTSILDYSTSASNITSSISFQNCNENISQTEIIENLVEYNLSGDNSTRYFTVTNSTKDLANNLFYYTVSLASIVCIYVASCIFYIVFHS